ncbi:MAG TPA: alpha/beta hydrolase [Polyangiales bacterium]|nr:alpha/beta hydrolase [Polyangiales bacterium]
MPLTPAFESWRREGKTFRHRGHAIFYRDEGQGPVLLAIHGFPSASWDWHPMWSALTARYRVIAPDMIGYGWSDKPRRYAYSLMDQAALHRSLLRALAIDRVHLFAHDYGVSVACELLAQQHLAEAGALTIDSLCLLNGGVFPETHRPLVIQRVLASRVGPILARLTRKSDFERGFRRIFAEPPAQDLLDELWRLLRHQDGRRVLPKLLGYMRERRVHRERWVTPLVEPRIPIRLIDGTVDPVSGKSLVARFRQLVPQADVVELPHAGHYPQLEDPQAVLRAFFAFQDAHASAIRPRSGA